VTSATLSFELLHARKATPEEEKGVVFWKKAEEESGLNDMPRDGATYRAPATEHTLILEGQPEHIETDADGEALNEVDRTLVELQTAAARKLVEILQPTTSHFLSESLQTSTRSFFICLWSASAAVVWVAGVLPSGLDDWHWQDSLD